MSASVSFENLENRRRPFSPDTGDRTQKRKSCRKVSHFRPQRHNFGFAFKIQYESRIKAQNLTAKGSKHAVAEVADSF
eukprot:5366385-Pleurochrysis_carterae.AAC.6